MRPRPSPVPDPGPSLVAVENPGMIEFFVAGPFDPARMYLLFRSFL